MSESGPLRMLFALPGLHRFERGAEIAFTSLAGELARLGDRVTMIGSGVPKADAPYRFIEAGSVRRERFERFPKIPPFRGETVYEEASFLPSLVARYRPADFDVTFTCSYPFTNWALRRPGPTGRPAHVFVTQNGDWPARSDAAEFRFFGCDGLVCTNPDYFEANRRRWRSALIPNGVAVDRFGVGPGERERFGIPTDAPVVLMVSALIASKRVADGVRAIAGLDGVNLVCAGDGPLRDDVDALARELLPGRFTRLTVTSAEMPALYRSADLFLHLSKDESFGNVYVEALASGLPIVAHDMERVRWIVGDGEFLADTDRVSSVRDAVLAAMRVGPDRVEARLTRAAEFDWPRVALRYQAFARQVVADWRGKAS